MTSNIWVFSPKDQQVKKQFVQDGHTQLPQLLVQKSQQYPSGLHLWAIDIGSRTMSHVLLATLEVAVVLRIYPEPCLLRSKYINQFQNKLGGGMLKLYLTEPTIHQLPLFAVGSSKVTFLLSPELSKNSTISPPSNRHLSAPLHIFSRSPL